MTSAVADAVSDAPVPPALDEQSFTELRAFICPAPEEVRWHQVGWRTTFWDAVREAQAHDKPILLWAMNGHPLACT